LSDALNQGVIVPSQSEWASNVVLVRKKDGTLRCCVDYRQLNNVSRKDAYPVPRQDACLDAFNGSSSFSSLDQRSAYNQILVNPADSDKTSFLTIRGTYKYRCLPFGLGNAVATFQRLMDKVLTGLNFEICLTYLDDVILFSST